MASLATGGPRTATALLVLITLTLALRAKNEAEACLGGGGMNNLVPTDTNTKDATPDSKIGADRSMEQPISLR